MTTVTEELLKGIRTTLREILTLQGYPNFSGAQTDDPLYESSQGPLLTGLEFSLPLSHPASDGLSSWMHRVLPDTEEDLKHVLRELIIERKKVEGTTMDSRKARYWSASAFQKEYFTLSPAERSSGKMSHEYQGLFGGLGATSSFQLPGGSSALPAELERRVTQDPADTFRDTGVTETHSPEVGRRITLPDIVIRHASEKWRQETSIGENVQDDSRQIPQDTFGLGRSDEDEEVDETASDNTMCSPHTHSLAQHSAPRNWEVEDGPRAPQASDENAISRDEDIMSNDGAVVNNERAEGSLLLSFVQGLNRRSDTSQTPADKTVATVSHTTTGKTQRRREKEAAKAQKEEERRRRLSANAKRAAAVAVMKGSPSLPDEAERDDGKSAVSVGPELDESEEVKAIETPVIQASDPSDQSAYDQLMMESSTLISSAQTQGSKGKTRRARVVSVMSGSFRSRLPPLPATCPITRLEAAQSLEKLMENLTEGEKGNLITAIDRRVPYQTRERIISAGSLKLAEAIAEYTAKVNPVIHHILKTAHELKFTMGSSRTPSDAADSHGQISIDTVARSLENDTVLDSLLRGRSRQHREDVLELLNDKTSLERKLLLMKHDPDDAFGTVREYYKQTRQEHQPHG